MTPCPSIPRCRICSSFSGMLCQGRRPGRVTVKNSLDGSGVVRVLTPVVYPDGRPLRELECADLRTAWPGSLVLVEWEPAPEEERASNGQPSLIPGLQRCCHRA